MRNEGNLVWFGLWCLMPLSIFSYIVQFYWWKKPEYPQKTTDKLYHTMLYRLSGIRTHNVSVDRY